MPSNRIGIDILFNYHKQEGQEELTYLTILFAVIIGIIGFLGSAQNINKIARLLILLFYIGLHYAMMTSFLESMKMHSAIHRQIAIQVEANPQMFYDGCESPLYKELIKLEPQKVGRMKIGGYSLLAFMILCILFIGKNSMLDLAETNAFKKVKSKIWKN